MGGNIGEGGGTLEAEEGEKEAGTGR